MFLKIKRESTKADFSINFNLFDANPQYIGLCSKLSFFNSIKNYFLSTYFERRNFFKSLIEFNWFNNFTLR